MGLPGEATFSRTVEYQFVLSDNVVPVAMKSKEASDALAESLDKTSRSVDRQSISYIRSVASMGAFRHGLRSMATGLDELNIVNRETNKTFYDVIGAVDVMVGAMLALKGIIGIFHLLAKAELGVALIETYRKIVNNPAWAAVALGAGIGTVATGTYLWDTYQDSLKRPEYDNPSVNQYINFYGGGPDLSQRYAARSSMEGAF